MADEMFTASEDQEMFQISNGRYIMDEDQSRKALSERLETANHKKVGHQHEP